MTHKLPPVPICVFNRVARSPIYRRIRCEHTGHYRSVEAYDYHDQGSAL